MLDKFVILNLKSLFQNSSIQVEHETISFSWQSVLLPNTGYKLLFHTQHMKFAQDSLHIINLIITPLIIYKLNARDINYIQAQLMALMKLQSKKCTVVAEAELDTFNWGA